ncbi:MAG: hypothetical protein AAGH19_09160 [Pseudomonadota bacterium]
MTYPRLTLGIVLLLCVLLAEADTIDDFSAPQGPARLLPDGDPIAAQITGEVPGALGRFRVLAPFIDDDAAEGSSVTATIAGGRFECDSVFTIVDGGAGGGCVVGWATDGTRAFDFLEAEAFEFDVFEAATGALIAVYLLGPRDDPEGLIPEGRYDGVAGLAFPVRPGSYRLPIDEFSNPLDPMMDFDLANVDTVLLATLFTEGNDGTTQIGALRTAGPIGEGNDLPPTGEVAVEQISGTYFNAARDGEGCQVTLEGDGVTVIMTCYLYQGGKQAWLIGGGTFEAGTVVFENMTITSGADFGAAFDPGDVLRTRWGRATLAWRDCNNANLTLEPELEGFLLFSTDVTKITLSDCMGPGDEPALPRNEGTLFDPARDGEGLQLAVQGETDIYVLTWYTYLDGEQVWLIGTGVEDGSRIAFDDLILTRGAGFGEQFNAEDVIREPWGSIVLDFTDCNNARATVTPLPTQPRFSEFETDVRKLVLGTCP